METVLSKEYAQHELTKMFNYMDGKVVSYTLPTHFVDEAGYLIVMSSGSRRIRLSKKNEEAVNEAAARKTKCIAASEEANKNRWERIIKEMGKKLENGEGKEAVASYFSRETEKSDKIKQGELAECDSEFRNSLRVVIDESSSSELPSILEGINNVIRAITSVIQQIVSLLQDLFQLVLKLLVDIVTFIANALKAIGDFFGKILSSVDSIF